MIMVLKENLSRLIQAIEDNSGVDIEEIQELIADTPQAEFRSSFKQFVTLFHTLTAALVKTKRSAIGINLLNNAILKLQTDQSQLTPLHADLCQLCLDSKCLNPALKHLEINYTDIKKIDDKDEDAKYVLLYYYYGGLIYSAFKNFERASYFFEVVLTVPANVMNPIMQETLKKQIILNLLMHGKLPENMLPKYTSQCVMRQKKQVSQSYLKLAHEYNSLNYEKILRFINGNIATFTRDDNMGLLKQCLTQVHKRNIQRLTKTFLTLPIRDVAIHVGLASEKEAELYILNMIDDGDIFATINQKDGMVVFEDNPEKYDSVYVFQKLQEDMSASIVLINTLKKMENDSGRKTVTMSLDASRRDD